MKPMNILLTAASRRVALVRAFRQALDSLGLDGRVVVTDVNPMSPAVHVADRWHLVPMADDPAYVETLLGLCAEERIGLVVPTIDDELEELAAAGRRFLQIGARIAISPASTNRLCGDKYATCEFLRAHGVPAAETFLPDRLPASPALPLFVKPRVGRGGVGAFAIRTHKELDFFLGYVDNPVVQQYLDGPEYSIDVLCNFKGRPLSIVPRERVVIRAGVIDRGRTVYDQRLIDLGHAVTRVLPFAGPLNIQCRLVDGRPVVFEINPRFAGGIPLTIEAGADFPRMLVELALGRRVPSRIGEFRDALWMTSYEASIFLDPACVDANAVHPPVVNGEAA